MKFSVLECIKELLYEHECVILPNFGGIITSYKGSEIDHISNSLIPPTKSISFNSYLKKDDGLLTNAFATLNKSSYSEASIEVKKWVEEVSYNLNAKRSYSLEGIGLFSLDIKENKISFNPIGTENFLIESYGLPIITANPILRSKTFEKKEDLKLQPIANSSPKFISPKSRKSKIYNSLIYACTALIFTSILLSIFNVEINKLSLDQASVFHILSQCFNSKSTTTFSPASSVDVAKTYPIKTNEELKIVSPKISILNSESKSVIDQTNVNETITPYRVVVGVFKEDKNASRMYTKLERLSLSVTPTLEKRKNLSYIFYSASSVDEAKAIQSNLATLQFESWVKKL